jgi:hypothetical protein
MPFINLAVNLSVQIAPHRGPTPALPATLADHRRRKDNSLDVEAESR